MSVFTSRAKSRFWNRENLDFCFNADTLIERVHIEEKIHGFLFGKPRFYSQCRHSQWWRYGLERKKNLFVFPVVIARKRAWEDFVKTKETHTTSGDLRSLFGLVSLAWRIICGIETHSKGRCSDTLTPVPAWQGLEQKRYLRSSWF